MLIAVALVLSVRIFFVLNHSGYWGVDGGAYLLSRNFVLGAEPTGNDFMRPLLAPGWLLVPFTYLFGDDGGLRAFAVFASIPMIPALYLLVRQFLTPWQTTFAMFAVMTDFMLAEMFTAGNLPMLGFAFMFTAMWAMWKLAHDWTARYALIAGACIGAQVWINQTATAMMVVILPAYVTGVIIGSRIPVKEYARRLILPAAIALIIGIGALPYYAEVLPGGAKMRYPGPLVTHYTFDNACWYYGAIILPFIVAAIWRGKGIVRALGVLMLAQFPLTFLVSFDEGIMNIFYRTRYWQMALFWPIFAHFVPIWWRALNLQTWLRPATVALSVVLLAGWLYQTQVESKLGRMMSADAEAATQWVMAQDPRGAIGTNSYSMSLYVAALTKHRSPWLQVYDPPRIYAQQHADMACAVGWTEGCDPRAAIARLNVDYLIIERLWPASYTEVAEQVPGLTPAYKLVEAANTRRHKADDVLGYTWDVPMADGAKPFPVDPYPWLITQERATWLERAWEQGTVLVYRVPRETWARVAQ